MTNITSAQIEIGRRVHYSGSPFSPAGDGLIVATYPHNFDAILFDGRRMQKIANSAFDELRNWNLLDRVHGPRLIEVMQQKAAEVIAAERLAQAKAAQHLADEVAVLVQQNPHLTQLDKYSNGSAVAKNVRAVLKASGIKGARVVTERGSMVSSIRVTLPAGLSGEQADAAKALCERFKLGNFNGMDDSYAYRGSAWTEAFGGVRYVFVHTAFGEV